jgi:hypothetical protein
VPLVAVDALLLEWIAPGSLPIYDLGENGTRYYQFRQAQWEPHHVRRGGRTLVSIEVDSMFPDFEEAIRSWLEALDRLTEVLGTLVFAIRTCCEFAGTRLVLAAMAFAPGPLIGSTPLEGANAADLIIQFCTGLAGEDSNRVHPAIREALARELARRQSKETALAKSFILLESYLKPEQVAEFKATGVFHVQIPDGRLFRFTKGFGHNVHLVENGVCVIEYCIITTEGVPLFDQILAQKILLEIVPDEFFRIANYRTITPVAEPPPPHPMPEFANAMAQT